MTWVRVDDNMFDHPKLASLSHAAFHVHIGALCYSNRQLSDGYIPTSFAHQFGKRYAAELVESGLWEPEGSGYRVHDFHDYQPSKAEVLELREKRSDAGKRGAEARWNDGKTHGKSHSKPHGKVDGKTMPHPVPTLKETDSLRSSVSATALEPRARNDQWDGLAAVFGYSASGPEAALWGKLVKQLADLGADKPGIEEAGRRYLVDMPTVTLTPSALVKHYQRLMARPVTARANGNRSAAENTLDLARQARERELHAGQ